MNIVKCPNPSCPFQFDASLVPPGAMIACPQCQLQFQLPQVAAPYPPAYPPSAPPAPTDAEPLFEGDAPNAEEADRPLVETTAPRKGGGGMAGVIALVAVGFVFICCGGVAGIGLIFGWFTPNKPEVADYRYEDYALGLSYPGEGWVKDDDTRTALGVNLACFSHTDPEGYAGVQARKTEGQAPADQLRPQAEAVLARQFDDLDETLTAIETTFLGVPAEKYEFTGRYRPTGTGCRGEVYAVVTGSTMLWVYTWADRDRFDDLAPAFAAFRDSVKLDKVRPADTMKRPEKVFRTAAGLYTLSDTEGQWDKQKGDPTTQDPAGDLWLGGRRRIATTGSLAGGPPEADLVVSVLDPTGDAKGQAKAHILEQFADGATVTEQAGEPAGQAPPSGEVPASDAVVRMTLKYPGADKSVEKMVVFTVADSGGKRVVAYAWCQLRRADYWEQRLMKLVGTLKALR